MKGQQISPWTFLKEKYQIQHQNQDGNLQKKQDVRLPKLRKTRQSMSKQQNQINQGRLQNPIHPKHFKTMVLNEHQHISQNKIFSLKKKTEPILYRDDEINIDLLRESDMLEYLNKMKLMVAIIHSSLEKHVQKPKINLDSIPKQKQSITSIAPVEQPYIAVSTRIHEKKADFSMSAIRSILKKQYEGISHLKNMQKSKKSNHILSLKLKLTEHPSKMH